MYCYKCDKSYIEKKGEITLSSQIIGTYSVFLETYYVCEGCNKQAYPIESVKKIEIAEKEIISERVKKLSVNEFISSRETAEILGITRQALNKHKRIKRGFIYSINIDNAILFHKKSVELFKDTGSGRFPLMQEVSFIDHQVKINELIKQNNTLNAENRKLEEKIIEQKKSTQIVMLLQWETNQKKYGLPAYGPVNTLNIKHKYMKANTMEYKGV